MKIDTSMYVLLTACLLALILPIDASAFKPAVIYILCVILVLSSKQLSFQMPTRRELKITVKLFFTNYALTSSVLVALGFIYPSYAVGFWLLALVPPAINVIPFSNLLGGDTRSAVFAELLSFVSALVIAPALAYLLLKQSIDISLLVKTMSIALIIPLCAAYFVKKTEKKLGSIPFSSEITTFGNAAIFFIIISSSRLTLFDAAKHASFWAMILVFIALKVVVSFILRYVLARSSKREMVDFLLFSIFKNTGLAAGLVAVLDVVPMSTLPIAVDSAFFAIYFMFTHWLLSRKVVIRKHTA
ncbi:MAG TPA: hypothetical protein VK158_02925 [Acidobacteriota bacterium]|nr:hypothetical protein [Acidobacteriota bacterium]